MNSHWNSTEAYDLSLYEVPAEPAKRPQPVPVAKNKAQSKKAAQRGAMRRLTASRSACSPRRTCFRSIRPSLS